VRLWASQSFLRKNGCKAEVELPFSGESENVGLTIASCFRYLCLEEACSSTVVKSVVILPALVHVLRHGKGAAVYRAAAGTDYAARDTHFATNYGAIGGKEDAARA